MITERILEFDICSYWHAGTGKGAGTTLDALVQRSPGNLPLLPGRTVRGLLRDALEQAVRVGAVADTSFEGGAVKWCFGTGLDDLEAGQGDRVVRLEEARFATRPGNLEIDSAVIAGEPQTAADWETGARTWEQWAAQNPLKVQHLFRGFASTRVEANGTAADGSLRAIEVAVPLKLYARVASGAEGAWVNALKEALPFIRGLGSHRNRGLGRVQVRMLEARP